MTALGLVLLGSSLTNLIEKRTAHRLAAGLWVAVFSATTSLILYWYKAHYGKELGSMVAMADARCCRCAGFVSASVAAALLLQQVITFATELRSIRQSQCTLY